MHNFVTKHNKISCDKGVLVLRGLVARCQLSLALSLYACKSINFNTLWHASSVVPSVAEPTCDNATGPFKRPVAVVGLSQRWFVGRRKAINCWVKIITILRGFSLMKETQNDGDNDHPKGPNSPDEDGIDITIQPLQIFRQGDQTFTHECSP